MGVGGRVPSGMQGPRPCGALAVSPPEANNTFCENMLLCHGLKNDIAIFAFTVNTKWKTNQCGGR